MKYAIVKSKDYEYLLEKEFVHWYAVAARELRSKSGLWTHLGPPFDYKDIQMVVGPKDELTEEEAFVELI